MFRRPRHAGVSFVRQKVVNLRNYLGSVDASARNRSPSSQPRLASVLSCRVRKYCEPMRDARSACRWYLVMSVESTQSALAGSPPRYESPDTESPAFGRAMQKASSMSWPFLLTPLFARGIRILSVVRLSDPNSRYNHLFLIQ